TWSFTTGNEVLSSPAVANGTVYVGSYDDNVYAAGTAAATGTTPGFEVGLVFVGLVFVGLVIAAYVVRRKR
ncbi:MAG: PQQ-binding-like beta-propeller repeat protein, partial [Halobacteriota archaeon]